MNFAESVVVGAEKLFLNIDLDAYTELTLKSLETPDFKIIDSSKITLSGNPAQMIVFSDKNEFGGDLQALAAWTIIDKNGYFIILGSEPSMYVHYLPTFQKILDSFEIDKTIKEEIEIELDFKDYTTHVDSVNGLKFQYPTQWNKLDLDEKGIRNIITSPLEDYNDGFLENVVIAIEEIPFGLLNLEMYSDISIKNLLSTTDFKIMEQSDTTLANLPAKKLVFSQMDPNYNIEITTLTVWTVKDDKAYVIALGAEPSKYSTYLPIFEKDHFLF